jgi:RNA polymerase sigma factor (sigma-70 family)
MLVSEAVPQATELGSDPQLAREREVLQQCRRGDWSQYGWLVERYRRLVWAAVDAVCDDPAGVEDLVQEVFMRVYEKLGTYRGESGFSSWLWRLARNHALGQRRRMLRRPRWVSLELRSGNSGTRAGYSVRDESDLRTSAALSSPDAQYVDAARDAAVRSMLARLPSDYREVLNLYYLGDYTYEDIAAATGLPLNTVRTRLRRARLRLADMARAASWD